MIAIMDYGVGNLFSVEKAFARFADDVKKFVLGDDDYITRDYYGF